MNKWNPVCCHPGCTSEADTIVTAIIPSDDAHRAVSSMCTPHAQGQAEHLERVLEFVPLGSGAWMNMREQVRLMRELEAGNLGDGELVPGPKGIGHLKRAMEAAGEADAMTLECDTHGTSPWRGEIICEACDRLYRLPRHDGEDGNPDLLEPKDPPFCDCGKPLTPGPDDAHAQDCTGRPVCPGCFEDHKPRRKH